MNSKDFSPLAMYIGTILIVATLMTFLIQRQHSQEGPPVFESFAAFTERNRLPLGNLEMVYGKGLPLEILDHPDQILVGQIDPMEWERGAPPTPSGVVKKWLPVPDELAQEILGHLKDLHHLGIPHRSPFEAVFSLRLQKEKRYLDFIVCTRTHDLGIYYADEPLQAHPVKIAYSDELQNAFNRLTTLWESPSASNEGFE